jgi:hypothetical protein
MSGYSWRKQTPADEFDFKAERVRLLQNERGDLYIDARGIRFRSTDGNTTIAIPMEDLPEADVADPRSLRFQRYEVKKWMAHGGRHMIVTHGAPLLRKSRARHRATQIVTLNPGCRKLSVLFQRSRFSWPV